MASKPQAPQNSNQEGNKHLPAEGKPPEGGTPPAGKPPEGTPPEGNKPAGTPPEGTPEGKPPEGQKRTTDNSDMYSSRMPPEWFNLVEILKAENPGKKIGAVLTATLKRGMEKEVEAELTATIHQHPTLDGAEYIRIRGELATILKVLTTFRADLLQIDQYPDDTERNNALAKMFTTTKETLEYCQNIAQRIGRIALLPAIPSGDDFDHLFKLKYKLTEFRKEASTPDERAIYTLALKLIAPYLP